MDLKNLFKNDYVKLALFAVLAYLAYRTFFVVREGVMLDIPEIQPNPFPGFHSPKKEMKAEGFMTGPHWGQHSWHA